MNLNDLAKSIAVLEGGKVNLPISQIKEVLRITLYLLAKEEDKDIIALIKRVRKRLKLT